MVCNVAHKLDARTRSEQAAITVNEAMDFSCLQGGEVIAGMNGIRRAIRGVNVLEDADIVRWMRGGELLLTTGYTFREDPSVLCSLIPALVDRDLAGLVIKIGLYVDELPDEVREVADRLDFPIIALPPWTMFDDILSEVLGTILNRQAVELERSKAIHERLTQVALAGGSFAELAAAVAELVHRPVGIRDAHGMVLAATEGAPDCPEAPHVARRIRVGEVDHGEIVVFTQGTEIAPQEIQTMEHAATVAAMGIAQERAVVSSEHRHRTLLLMQLVSRTPVDRTEMTRWATAMGWHMDVPQAVVLVELRDGDRLVSVAGQPLEDRLLRAAKQALEPDTIVWALGYGLAVLVEPKPTLGAACRDLHAALRRLKPAMSVMVAAGRVAEDVRELSRSYEEAVSALALGHELQGDDFVLEHEELGAYRLLASLTTEDLQRHRAEALGPLLEYDRTHQGSLLRTLDVFLRCDRNRVRAAEELFVHYNTLRYRLRKIEELTGGLSGDTMSRLSLELALCAHRLLLGRGESEPAVGARWD